MNIDLGSFAFGSNLEAGTGTPSWGTALGQSFPDYRITYPGSEAILIGMIYCSVPLNRVSMPIGKGGSRYNAASRDECQIASLFRKVYINGTKIDYPFIMVLFKEESDSHPGRKSIKYSDKNNYNDGEEHYSNQEFIDTARNVLGIKEDACWFVYKIEVINQDELHLYAIIVDKDDSVVYANSSERKRAWLQLIPEEDSQMIQSSEVSDIDNAQQKIYYGTPGSGKSKRVKREVANKYPDEAKRKEFVFRTTFHPDSDYASFVGCYKPSMRRSEKIYTEEELMAKLKEIKESGVTYPCHKFATKYWESLKDLDASTIKNILSSCGFTESMAVEVSKGVAIGQDFLNISDDGKIIYTFTPQTFTKAYLRAWQTEEPVYLVIEEINRGNCAQIFGDLFQLLDRKNGVSEYPIKADSDLAAFIGEQLSTSTRVGIPKSVKSGEELMLPSNLNILATMNTSDQSLFPMDSAFKRRWTWECVPIDYNNADSSKFIIDIAGTPYNWHKFLKNVNDRIKDVTQSEDKQMGNFFINGDVDARQFIDKVMFYLWNDICKEEYKTKNNFFRNYTDDAKTDSVEFTFNDLFDISENKDNKLLVGFMDYIGVEPEK